MNALVESQKHSYAAIIIAFYITLKMLTPGQQNTEN